MEKGAIIPLIHRGNVSGISLAIEGFGDPNGWDSYGLWAPHVIRSGDTYYMFYGDWGNICLASSRENPAAASLFAAD